MLLTPSSSGDGLHIAGPSSRVVRDNIAGPSAGVSSEEGANVSAMEGVMEGDLVADSFPKTSLDILGKLVEDWLETLWTKMKQNLYPHFYFTI